MRFVITGATGLVGREVVLRLLSLGHETTVVTRTVKRAKNVLGAESTFVCWSDSEGLKRRLDGADCVVHLAGEPIADKRWSERQKSTLWSSRVDLTEKLVSTMAECVVPPKVLVSASAVGFYGHRENVVDESSEAGEGFTSRLAVAWEQAARGAERLGTRVVCLRLGLVLAREGAFKLMSRAYHCRVGARIGSGSHGMSWIHMEDVLRLILWSKDNPKVAGIVNAVAPDMLTQSQVHDTFERHFGSQWSPAVGSKVLSWALGERAKLITHGARVLPQVAQRLGYVFAYDHLSDALQNLTSDEDISGIQIVPVTDGRKVDGKRAQYYLTAKTFVPHSIQEVAPWFETPANLTLMTPGFMDFQILRSDPMKEGAEIAYTIKLFRVPMRWQSEIPIFEPGYRFVDTQRKGPYNLWWHEHTFEAENGGTWITDHVHYSLPMGVLGRLAHKVWVGPTLRRIFAFRYLSMQSRFGDVWGTKERISA